jgi:hypothetical protein
MVMSINNSAWLEWISGLMGGKSRQTQAASFPPDRYYCLLDELPVHLVPGPAWRALRLERDRDLYLNPECRIRPAEDLPEEFESSPELLSRFARQATMAWVRDSASGSLLPFWLGHELAGFVRDLGRGERVPASLPSHMRSVLAAAGILIHEGSNSIGHEERIETARSRFREKGYAPLSGLIHPFHVAALRRYYRYLIRTGAICLGDQQSSRRYVAHNEPVARFFHHLIAPALSRVAGEPLKPSYVYLASYLSGAELTRHTDREQCEFSITFCLDFSPEPALRTPWPIKLDTPAGTVVVHQALGDGLAYRGTRLPHYRSRLGEGQTSTSIFFHYVSADFTGTLN